MRTAPPRDFLLYGARADVDRIVAEQRPPEKLGQFERIEVAEEPLPVHVEGRPAQRVATAWIELESAIRKDRECEPSLNSTYKIHCIWDAAEQSVADRSWVDVTYG